MMNELALPCIRKQAQRARKRVLKLDTLYLLRDCARNPSSANGLGTLEGMAQENCIYDIE